MAHNLVIGSETYYNVKKVTFTTDAQTQVTYVEEELLTDANAKINELEDSVVTLTIERDDALRRVAELEELINSEGNDSETIE